MSQDSVEILAEYLSPACSKKDLKKQTESMQNGVKNSATKNNNSKSGHIDASELPKASSTPMKSGENGKSASDDEDEPISLSQDIMRRPNKYFASPTKTPSKKSPVLSKYSPFRKNSPGNKFKHFPIDSYFKSTPEKSDESKLQEIFKEVNKKDVDLFESLLSDDGGVDLTQMCLDEKLLSPLVSPAGSASKTVESVSKVENSKGDASVASSSIQKQASHGETDDETIFKEKKMKKKVKKMLFPKSVTNQMEETISQKKAVLSEINHSSEENLTQMNGPSMYRATSRKKDFSKKRKIANSSDISSEKTLTESSLLHSASEELNDTSSISKYLKKGFDPETPSSSKSFETFTPSREETAKPKIPTKSEKVESPEKPSSQSQSSPSYLFGDSYSKCVEAILQDCLLYLRENKERGIFVNLEELGKLVINGSMHQTRKRLYARLLINRKFKWYRFVDLKNYETALSISSENLLQELNELEKEGLLTSNLDDVDLTSLLNLLPLKDLKTLCKFSRLRDNKPKPELIKKLVENENKQSSITSFSQNSSYRSKNQSIFFKRVKELLGPCIKLCQGPRKAFFHCLIFVTYPFFNGDPTTRLTDYMSRITSVQKNELSFPQFTVHKSVIFSEDRMFTMYQEALDMSEMVFTTILNKDWETLTTLTETLKSKFEEILADKNITSYVENLPLFLRRYTAGDKYARGLLQSVRENKKSSDKNIVVSVLNLLLSQKFYVINKRGLIYEELASTYQIHLKNNVKAMETIINGLKDSLVNDIIMKHTLSIRGNMLKRRKTNALPAELKTKADEFLLEDVPDPTFVIIHARSLDGKPGFKQVYISETEDGLEFSSVEELTKLHYKKKGFSQMLHDEGATLRSLIYACFWDIIYEQPKSLVSHSVFHSHFQSQPLDWGSSEFYSHRKEKIKERLEDLEKGGTEIIVGILTSVCDEFENVSSVVNWNFFSKTRLNLLKDFLSALTVKIFCKLSHHLLKNVRLYGKGFPDLTMWNPAANKCVFVEVKSPNDRLSCAQKVWLYNLNKMGANAEVCNIQTTGSKKRKLIDAD